MTGDNSANDMKNGDTTINFNENKFHSAVKSAAAEEGTVHRDVEVADNITVELDWNMDERVLPVSVLLKEERVPDTDTAILGDVSSALNGLQADLDGVFYHALDFDKRDYGNRAQYEKGDANLPDGYALYTGTISNPTSVA